MKSPKPNSARGALNTLIHSLTAGEWTQALEAAKKQSAGACDGENRRDSAHPRHQAVCRCLLRVDRGEAAPGLYVVRSRDISDVGMRLIHGGPIEPETVCCVIIQTEGGQSLAAGGVVAWCQPIASTEPGAYELGVRFYQPIDAGRFAQMPLPDEDAA